MKLIFFLLLLFFPHLGFSKDYFLTAEVKSWSEKYSKLDLTNEESLKKAIAGRGPLSSWLLLQLASLYISQNKYDQAISYLKQIPEQEKIWDFWKNTKLAQAYLGLNQTREAVKLLEFLPMEPEVTLNSQQDFYRKLYHEALMTKKNQNKIWALFPDWEKEEVFELLTPSVEYKVNRLHVLIAKKLEKKLPDLIRLHEILQADLAQDKKCQVLDEWATGHRLLKKSPEALGGYTQIIVNNCGEPYLAKAYYWKASIQTGLKKFDEAIKTYEEFLQKFPDHRYTDDAYYSLWKIHRQLKQETKAKEYYDQLLSLSQGDMKAKILWAQAYHLYKKGKFKNAIKHFDQILSLKSLQDEAHPQALYWKIRSLEKLGEMDEAKAIYRLIPKFPFSFYSLLGYYRLGDKPKFFSFKPLKPSVPLHSELMELVTVVNILNQMDHNQEAQELLDYFSQQNQELVKNYPELMALKWMESGDYHRSLEIASDTLDSSVFATALDPTNPMAGLFYPMVFLNEIKKGSHVSHLSLALIHGVIREESLFRKKINSVAGALGLMQLIPSTAQIQATKINLLDFELDQLGNPETNILLGSTFLSDMVNRYDGNIPLAIMAYNAGPGNVDKWLKQKGDLPLDEFIEEVPFSETKGYVKRVLRSTQIYRVLLKESGFQKEFFLMESFKGRKGKKGDRHLNFFSPHSLFYFENQNIRFLTH